MLVAFLIASCEEIHHRPQPTGAPAAPKMIVEKEKIEREEPFRQR